MKSFFLFLFVNLVLTLTSCSLLTERPKLEMAMAAEALWAAKQAQADSFAQGPYRKAEDFYVKAKSQYRQKFFDRAKQMAILAKIYAEKAEEMAMVKKTQE